MKSRFAGTASGTLDGLLAAALFGLSAPLSKLLVADVDPVVLAGLLYLGAGACLALLMAALAVSRRRRGEARLERGDVPWLIAAVSVGGVAAPLCLLFGLARTPAATASLLLTFEAASTAGLAALFFRESVGRATWVAVALVTAGGVLLSIDPAGAWGLSSGALLVVAACVLWGLDNNLTRQISLRDPKAIVSIKGLGAGGFSLVLGLALGRPFPTAGAAAALALGAVSYGVSIALFVRSLRKLGAARTGALFGTAPFLAAGVSLAIFREPPPATTYAAFPLVLVAAWLLARESGTDTPTPTRRSFTRTGTPTTSTMRTRMKAREARGTHSHEHAHEALVHAHDHRPDEHHRHTHESGG